MHSKALVLSSTGSQWTPAGADLNASRHFGAGGPILQQMKRKSLVHHLGVLKSHYLDAECLCSGCAMTGCLVNPFK